MNRLKLILNRVGNKPILLFDQLLVSGSHFIISIILARVLGAGVFGWFALGWMILLFISSIHQAFVTTPFMSLYPKLTNDDKIQAYIQGVKANQLMASILFLIVGVFAFLVFYGFQIKAMPLNYLILFIGVILVYLQYDFIRKKCFALQKVQSIVALDVLAYAFQLLAFFYAWYTQQLNLSVALCIILSGYLLASISFFKHLLFKIDVNIFLTTYKKHWQFGKWLIGKSVIQWFTGNYFILTAGVIIGPVALGLVKMAQNIIGVLNVLFIIFENILPAKAAHVYKTNNKAALVKYLNNFSLKALPLIIIGLLLVSLFAEKIALLLYNEASTELLLLIRGFAILYVFVFLIIPLTVYIKTIEQTQILFWAYVVGLLFSFASAHFLVQHFAYTGVLIGLIANQVIMMIAYLIGTNFPQSLSINFKHFSVFKNNKNVLINDGTK